MRSPATIRCTLLAAWCTLAAPAAFAQKINDVVVRKDGSRLRAVEVTEARTTGVRGKRGAEPFVVAASDVAAIEWSDGPEPFVAGRAALARGDYRAAMQLFGKVQSGRALVKADAAFFAVAAAVCASGDDPAAAAAAAVRAKKWLAEHEDHWRTLDALLLAGRAERLAGTTATAATTLRTLDERASRDGSGAIQVARARAELASTLLADGKPAEARATFQAAAAAADGALGKVPADDAALRIVKTMARIGEGETFLAAQDWAASESFFRSLASSNQPALAAAGQAGIGETIFLSAVADGRGDEHTADLRRAQIALATASVGDGGSGGAPGRALDDGSNDTSAKANYYLGRCLLALGPEHEGPTCRQRADGYFQIVAVSYPTSRWAGAARSELSR